MDHLLKLNLNLIVSINYYFEDIKEFTIDFPKSSSWIQQTISKEKHTSGDISFIFCSDLYLLGINKEYLKHDYFTDIITFDYVEDGIVSGDIFISIDRVKENATLYKVDFLSEINRIMIHGILHLLGYKDKKPADKSLMTNKEDYYLSIL